MNTQEHMSDYPLVTIGITTYNNVHTQFDCEKVLRRGLDCFANQDYPNLEIIIQDDCSTDNTFNVCKEYAEKYSFIKLFKNKENLGADLNIKHLTQRVNGEFFIWGCIDDIYEKSYISKCCAKLIYEPSKSVCQSSIKTIYQDRETIDVYEDMNPPLTQPKIEELTQILFKRESYLGECSALNPLIHGLIRTEFLKLIFGFPCLLYYEISLPIILIWAGGVCVVKEILFTNEAKRLFNVRYPESSFVKQTSSNLFLFICGLKILLYFIKIYFRGHIKVNLGVIIKTWGHLFHFYCLKKIKGELKVSLFNFINKFFPPIISLYRFFKKHFQS